jgi:acyl dehydratase
MINTSAIGKKHPAVLYEVTKNGIAEYARTIGIGAPFHFGHEAACEAGFRGIVAPPMYAAEYSAPAIFATINDPEVGMDVPRNLHASQQFVWSEPVSAGDTQKE